MSAGWVAASVRSRAMAQRRVGAAGARTLAARSSLGEALEILAETPYGRDVRAGQSLAQAQRAVAVTLLWHLRVLAGWVPRGDSRVLRILAGGYEVANVDERLREVTGGSAEDPFHLGGLATAWTSLSTATSPADVREILGRSAWGDPGADGVDGIRLGMRLSWAARVSAAVPGARPWAAAAAALLVARPLLLDRGRIPETAALIVTPLLGARWPEAASAGALAASLPPEARWVLAGVEDPADLWRAESRWWTRVSADGFGLLRKPVTTADPVLGAVAVLAADAWRVRAALEVAARGGESAPGAMEAFDAVA
jgi:hypothetical protein